VRVLYPSVQKVRGTGTPGTPVNYAYATRHIIGRFWDDSFQAVDRTGTDNLFTVTGC